MSIKEIITVPDPILKKISSPIEKISINEKKLIKDLKDTMYNANGIGLAAIQIGIPKRIVIVDVTKEDEKKNLHCLINPKIKKFSDDRSSYEEGCLSIPNTFIQIERPREIEMMKMVKKKLCNVAVFCQRAFNTKFNIVTVF